MLLLGCYGWLLTHGCTINVYFSWTKTIFVFKMSCKCSMFNWNHTDPVQNQTKGAVRLAYRKYRVAWSTNHTEDTCKLSTFLLVNLVNPLNLLWNLLAIPDRVDWNDWILPPKMCWTLKMWQIFDCTLGHVFLDNLTKDYNKPFRHTLYDILAHWYHTPT